ncbi:MAG: mRNA surveillance protein pelota [Candidatus Odinarchaeum yellowstonii]|uniref:Protein pelota homolog n=1 Tax=Odinarchaeota yellowstonii (strain LCB_4) TaxID=1841599 RepID=A0AAF0IBS9_ODILC|nr:MAG: mRNA surveillance protein pelota [Candidatus Odinarchaeum yellowstonii]
MRILFFDEKKSRMKIKVESLDDLWTLYNIISKNDIVYGRTFRRIKQNEEAIRADKGERIPVYLGIRVEETSFHGFADRLRIKGRIVSGPEDLISAGSFHTLNVEVDSQIEIVKDRWSKTDLKRIDEALKSSSSPVIILCAVDSNEASIALMGSFQTKIVTRITESIPGKRLTDKENTEAYQRFYASILKVIETLLGESRVDYIIIAGPGFVKDHLRDYIIHRKPELKNMIITDTVSSGDVSGINEIIKRGAAISVLSKMRVIEHSSLIEDVLKRLAKNSGDVAYGFDDVRDAAERGAVQTLLVTDELVRSLDETKRSNVHNLIEIVENMSGDVKIFSVQTPPGEQLKGLGGVAALLRFNLFKDSRR